MAYTPTTLTMADWASPVTIVGTDIVANLDETVNTIISTDPSSLKTHVNTELAKVPTYLSDELKAMYNDLDAFGDVYLGAKETAPTLDNDGNALLEGAIYWNTASKGMFTWNGSSWQVWNGGVTLDTAQTISGAKDFTVVPKANGTDLATLDTAQTISGAKNFTTPPTINGEVVYHESNILGTVSQTSGVPTGAIIERGSNANGTYVKFADGTLICFGSFTYLATTTASQTVTFPTSFIDANYYVNISSGISSSSNAGSLVCETAALDVSSFKAKVLSHTASTVDYISADRTARFGAIGRWF